MSAVRLARHKVWQALVLLMATLVLSSCGNWRGMANVPLPGGPGTGSGSYTVYVQMPDTLALNGNSRVLVADVFVGRVRAIDIKNWVAVLTLDLEKGVHLPKNATAKIGQTSLLGSQHVELAAPPDPSPLALKNGDTIPLKSSSAYPTIERTLAAFATTLHGGGIPNLDVVQNEVYNVLNGRAPQIREFLGKLDTFTAQLNQQRDDIIRTIDSTNRLLTYVASRSDTLNQVLTDFPPLVAHLADTRELFVDAFDALGRLGDVSGSALSATRDNLDRNLQLLQRPLKQLARGAPN
ncbi:MAG: MCE family protein, partial [Mycobacterium sp.]